MAKKKDKSQVINNIQELNLEIDYDKLAEEIVKANQKETLQQSNMKYRGIILGLFNVLVFTTPIILILKTFYSDILLQMSYNITSLELTLEIHN